MRVWSDWRSALEIVKPETAIGWLLHPGKRLRPRIRVSACRDDRDCLHKAVLQHLEKMLLPCAPAYDCDLGDLWRDFDDSSAPAAIRCVGGYGLRFRRIEGGAPVDGGSRLLGGAFVVYVAARPPRSIFRSIAAQVGRKILYLPIGALSPAKLKKLRVVHVLDSYERRTEAKDYLW